MSDSSEACKAKACAIQDCLQSSGYNEAKCSTYIDDLYKCCREFYEQNGPDAKSVCCPKFKLLQLKLKQRSLNQMDATLIEHRKG
ncbi:uncharacterized protein LODBEIA_P43940 [Lodderomyces beijingensis]|uniref:Cx9C motif-containing protein 4, mitochondrial n=1 Tax=Lodderomyces beijingensis TaxID=1775926 RepID=A0ABP0ZV85_9ASCO